MAKKPTIKRAATTDEFGRRVLSPGHQARRHTDGPVKPDKSVKSAPDPGPESIAPEAEE